MRYEFKVPSFQDLEGGQLFSRGSHPGLYWVIPVGIGSKMGLVVP